jgi:hypothetical protein
LYCHLFPDYQCTFCFWNIVCSLLLWLIILGVAWGKLLICHFTLEKRMAVFFFFF